MIRIIDKRSLLRNSVKNVVIFAALLTLIFYRSISRPLFGHVGNWRYSIFSLELEIVQRLREGAFGVCNQVSPYISDVGINSTVVSFTRGIWRFSLMETEVKGRLEGKSLDVKIIKRWIFRYRDVWAWTGLSCLWIGTGDVNLWMW